MATAVVAALESVEDAAFIDAALVQVDRRAVSTEEEEEDEEQDAGAGAAAAGPAAESDGSMSDTGIEANPSAVSVDIDPPPRSYIRSVVWCCVLTFILWGGQMLVILSVLPDRIIRSYNGGVSCDGHDADTPGCKHATAHATLVTSAVASAGCFVTFLGSPLLGSAADAFGRRPPLIFCAVLNFLQFAAMLGWVYELVPLWVYFAANVLASFDSTSVMLAYLSDVVPAPQRAYCFGLLFATISLGVVVAPFVAVALGSGNNAPFLVAAGVSLFYLILVCFVPESLPKSKRVPFSSLRDLNPFRIIGVLGRYKMFQRLALVVLLGELAMRGRFAINFPYLKSRFHITESQFAYVALTFGVLGVLSQSVLLKWLVRRWSNQRIMLLGLCAVVLNMLSFVVIWKLWMVYPTEIFSCLSFLSFPAVSAMKSNNVADSEQGKIQGALYGVKQLGGGMGPVLFGLMFNAMGDPDDGEMYHPTLVWWLGAAVALITVFIGFSVPQAVTSDEQQAYEKEKEKEKEKEAAAAAAAADTAVSEALASVVVCDSPSINGGMVTGDTNSLMQPLMPPHSAQSW